MHQGMLWYWVALDIPESQRAVVGDLYYINDSFVLMNVKKIDG